MSKDLKDKHTTKLTVFKNYNAVSCSIKLMSMIFITFIIQVNLWEQQGSNLTLGEMTTNICLELYTVFEVVSHTLFHLSLTTHKI